MRTELLLSALLLLAPRASAAVTGPHLSTAAAAQLDEGLARLYSLDYVKSRAAFRKLIELDPDNPFGYLFEAGGIWWESSQEFGLFTSTPTLQGLFEEDVEAAQRKADAYMDSKDPRTRADGYFVSGMALGTLGQWRLMKRHMMDAYFIGKKAVKHLKKAAKIDPNYADVRLGLGVFDYQTAHLSGIAKLGILFGMKGNEKRGLEGIIYAMENSPSAGRQAAQILSQIYITDMRDYARALPVVQRLGKDFPDSPYFVFMEAMLRDRLGDWDGSLVQGRKLFAMAEADPSAFRPKWLTLVCGLSGANCLAKEDLERPLAWFDHAIESTAKEKPTGFHALLRLSRGQLLDLLGRRPEAVADYKKARALPEFDFVRERASACLAAPCGKDGALRWLRALKEDPAP
jgi:tetratricopeptide (TPR) repeat protein